jgi:hypothetical protein
MSNQAENDRHPETKKLIYRTFYVEAEGRVCVVAGWPLFGSR